jgi:hypothetical protein
LPAAAGSHQDRSLKILVHLNSPFTQNPSPGRPAPWERTLPIDDTPNIVLPVDLALLAKFDKVEEQSARVTFAHKSRRT